MAIAPELRVVVVQDVPGDSISATQRGTLGDLLAHQHASPHIVPSLPACSAVPLAIHHRHWADRCTASTLRHFLQPL